MATEDNEIESPDEECHICEVCVFDLEAHKGIFQACAHYMTIKKKLESPDEDYIPCPLCGYDHKVDKRKSELIHLEYIDNPHDDIQHNSSR